MVPLKFLLCVIPVFDIVAFNVAVYVPCQDVQSSCSKDTTLPDGSVQVQSVDKRSKRETPEDWQRRLEQLKQCLNAFSPLCLAITQASLDSARVSPSVAGALIDIRSRIWNIYFQSRSDLESLSRSLPPNFQPPRPLVDAVSHMYPRMAYAFVYFSSAYEYLRHTNVQILPPSQARFPFYFSGVELSLQDTRVETSVSSTQWIDNRWFESARLIGEFDRDHIASELGQIAHRIRTYLSLFVDMLESSAVVFSEVLTGERRRAYDDLERRLKTVRRAVNDYLCYLQTNPRDSLDRLRRISENSQQTVRDVNLYLTQVLQMSANYVGIRFELDNELLYGDMSAAAERQVTDPLTAIQRLQMRYNVLYERRTQIQAAQSHIPPELAQLLPDQTPTIDSITNMVANAHQQIQSFSREALYREGLLEVDLYTEFLNIVTCMNRIMADLNRLGDAYAGISNACNFVPSTK